MTRKVLVAVAVILLGVGPLAASWELRDGKSTGQESSPASHHCDKVITIARIGLGGDPASYDSILNIHNKTDSVWEGVATLREGNDQPWPGNWAVDGLDQTGNTTFDMRLDGGPCPPPGEAHRYFFRLYVLDTQLQLQDGATRAELAQAIEGHVLGTAQMMVLAANN